MDYLVYNFDISGTTPDNQAWDQQGSVTLRYNADDFVPMIQRAIQKTFFALATGVAPLQGPYQITGLTLTAVLPMEGKADAKKAKAA